MELNYPHEVDDSEKRTAAVKDPRLYTMRPLKDNQVEDNFLVFLPFFINRFSVYQGWPQFFNYYMVLFIHYVRQEDGTNAMVACPKKTNYHAGLISKSHPVPMPFPPPNDKCAMCNYSQGYWSQYDNMKKAAGLDRMSREAFNFALQRNPDIARMKDMARHWSPTERYYFGVFDMAKATGRKPLEDVDQGVVRIQGCFGPKKIFTDLELKRAAGYKFYDVDGGNFREVIVRRDNSKSARFCTYALEVNGQPPTLSAEVVTYLKSYDVPDPFLWVAIWTADQMQSYIDAQMVAERDFMRAPAQIGATAGTGTIPPTHPAALAFGITPPPGATAGPVTATPQAVPPPTATPPVTAAVSGGGTPPLTPSAPAPVTPPPPTATTATPVTPPPPSAPSGGYVPPTAPPPAPPTPGAAAPMAAGPAAAGPPMGDPPTEARRSRLKWR